MVCCVGVLGLALLYKCCIGSVLGSSWGYSLGHTAFGSLDAFDMKTPFEAVSWSLFKDVRRLQGACQRVSLALYRVV